jgi:hypothetical protein
MVWEVIEAHTSTDGKPYVVLFNLSDPTWRKTLSLAELESGSQYIPLPRHLRPQPAFPLVAG